MATAEQFEMLRAEGARHANEQMDVLRAAAETQANERLATLESRMMREAKEQIQSMMDSHDATVKNLMSVITTIQGASSDKPKEKWADKISEKSYRRITAFSGGESNWQEWKYDFQVATRAANKDVGIELDHLLAQAEPRSENELRDLVASGTNNWEPEKRSKELFEVLIMLTTGEAKGLIRDAGDGFKA